MTADLTWNHIFLLNKVFKAKSRNELQKNLIALLFLVSAPKNTKTTMYLNSIKLCNRSCLSTSMETISSFVQIAAYNSFL